MSEHLVEARALAREMGESGYTYDDETIIVRVAETMDWHAGFTPREVANIMKAYEEGRHA